MSKKYLDNPKRFPCYTLGDVHDRALKMMKHYATQCRERSDWRSRDSALYLKGRYEYTMALANALLDHRGDFPYWYLATVCRGEWQGCTADAGVDAAGIQARVRGMLPEGLGGWWTLEIQACTNPHPSGEGYLTLPHAHGIVWSHEPLPVERIMARTNRMDAGGVHTLDLQTIGTDGAVLGNLLYCAGYVSKMPYSLKTFGMTDGVVDRSTDSSPRGCGDIYDDLSNVIAHHRLAELCWGIGDDAICTRMRAHFM